VMRVFFLIVFAKMSKRRTGNSKTVDRGLQDHGDVIAESFVTHQSSHVYDVIQVLQPFLRIELLSVHIPF
jgi:hypothetical protein